MNVRVGVLAVQGAFLAHAEVLCDLGVEAVEVRQPNNLEGLDAIVLPGGESTTMSKLLVSTGLWHPLNGLLHGGLPVFGTCAGMILLGTSILDGRPDQSCFGVIDIAVRRNAYGRQIDSFEADIDTAVGQFHGVFIRAPRIEAFGAKVEVLGTHNNEPVIVRQGTALAAAFHPELSADVHLHQFFITHVAGLAPATIDTTAKGR
ncbi:MAG: pyridoxal 5'-phosphate synthase glutaminase subunit PdxT [Actinobacteria bacterium]|nr:pyridoxal 5'-phosphate synthase glutaminase subunit PdxT [Actinomycetota bacterium]